MSDGGPGLAAAAAGGPPRMAPQYPQNPAPAATSLLHDGQTAMACPPGSRASTARHLVKLLGHRTLRAKVALHKRSAGARRTRVRDRYARVAPQLAQKPAAGLRKGVPHFPQKARGRCAACCGRGAIGCCAAIDGGAACGAIAGAGCATLGAAGIARIAPQPAQNLAAGAPNGVPQVSQNAGAMVAAL